VIWLFLNIEQMGTVTTVKKQRGRLPR
jgi:hypothetical protein